MSKKHDDEPAAKMKRKEYEQELRKPKTIALQEMEAQAEQLGGNAVVGVDLDYEVLGADNGMLMVTASGTGVVLT